MTLFRRLFANRRARRIIVVFGSLFAFAYTLIDDVLGIFHDFGFWLIALGILCADFGYLLACLLERIRLSREPHRIRRAGEVSTQIFTTAYDGDRETALAIAKQILKRGHPGEISCMFGGWFLAAATAGRVATDPDGTCGGWALQVFDGPNGAPAFRVVPLAEAESAFSGSRIDDAPVTDVFVARMATAAFNDDLETMQALTLGLLAQRDVRLAYDAVIDSLNTTVKMLKGFLDDAESVG